MHVVVKYVRVGMGRKAIVDVYKGMLVRGKRDGVNDGLVESLPQEWGLIPTKGQ